MTGVQTCALPIFEAAQIVLGHKTDSMTQRYAERDAEKARELVAKIG